MSHPDLNIAHRIAVKARTNSARWLAVVPGALVASAAGAQLPLNTIEECLETGTDVVSLPGVAGGTLAASACSGCPALNLRFAERTRYYIGKEAVKYAELREAASKDDLRLDVFYEPKTRVLTRLRLAAAGGVE